MGLPTRPQRRSSSGCPVSQEVAACPPAGGRQPWPSAGAGGGNSLETATRWGGPGPGPSLHRSGSSSPSGPRGRQDGADHNSGNLRLSFVVVLAFGAPLPPFGTAARPALPKGGQRPGHDESASSHPDRSVDFFDALEESLNEFYSGLTGRARSAAFWTRSRPVC